MQGSLAGLSFLAFYLKAIDPNLGSRTYKSGTSPTEPFPQFLGKAFLNVQSIYHKSPKAAEKKKRARITNYSSWSQIPKTGKRSRGSALARLFLFSLHFFETASIWQVFKFSNLVRVSASPNSCSHTITDPQPSELQPARHSLIQAAQIGRDE